MGLRRGGLSGDAEQQTAIAGEPAGLDDPRSSLGRRTAVAAGRAGGGSPRGTRGTCRPLCASRPLWGHAAGTGATSWSSGAGLGARRLWTWFGRWRADPGRRASWRRLDGWCWCTGAGRWRCFVAPAAGCGRRRRSPCRRGRRGPPRSARQPSPLGAPCGVDCSAIGETRRGGGGWSVGCRCGHGCCAGVWRDSRRRRSAALSGRRSHGRAAESRGVALHEPAGSRGCGAVAARRVGARRAVSSSASGRPLGSSSPAPLGPAGHVARGPGVTRR